MVCPLLDRPFHPKWKIKINCRFFFPRQNNIICTIIISRNMYYISNTTILSTYRDSVSTSSKERVESSRKHVPQAGNFEFMRIFCKLCCSISFSRMKIFSTILEIWIWILQTRFYLTLFHICREKKCLKFLFLNSEKVKKDSIFIFFLEKLKQK